MLRGGGRRRDGSKAVDRVGRPLRGRTREEGPGLARTGELEQRALREQQELPAARDSRRLPELRNNGRRLGCSDDLRAITGTSRGKPGGRGRRGRGAEGPVGAPQRTPAEPDYPPNVQRRLDRQPSTRDGPLDLNGALDGPASLHLAADAGHQGAAVRR